MSENTQEVYKVLWPDREKNVLKSAMTYEWEENFPTLPITYPTDGSIVSPKVGKLFVFADFNCAEKFRDIHKNQVIWLCEATNVIAAPQRIGFYKDLGNNIAQMESLWREIMSRHYDFIHERFQDTWNQGASSPEGSLLCDSLKLIRRID